MNQIKQYLLKDAKQFQGQVDERFNDLATQFAFLQNGRRDAGGAALVVYFQGQKVVDIYTGLKAKNSLWQADTLSVCYSTGKGVLATLAHLLVNAGVLGYDQPIADYWPEFAAHHKHQLTLRHVLSHQSGLFDIRNNIEHAREMLDWSHMLNVMAAATSRFQVGRDNAYQALTFGWLVGGALEKASGLPLAQLMQQYLVTPLQLDGAYFGVPAHELARVARPLKLSHLSAEFDVSQHNPTTDAIANLTPSKGSSAPKPSAKPRNRSGNWSDKLVAWDRTKSTRF